MSRKRSRVAGTVVNARQQLRGLSTRALVAMVAAGVSELHARGAIDDERMRALAPLIVVLQRSLDAARSEQ